MILRILRHLLLRELDEINYFSYLYYKNWISGTDLLPKGCLSQLQIIPPSGGSFVQRKLQISALEGSAGAAIL